MRGIHFFYAGLKQLFRNYYKHCAFSAAAYIGSALAFSESGIPYTYTCIGSLALCQNSKSCDAAMLNSHFVADAAEIVAPAVVNILCVVESFMMSGASSGSGFIISKDGFIATNAHVVAHAVDGKVLVTLWDGTKRVGSVYALDRRSDIALVKLTDLDIHSEELQVATLGSSGSIRAGEFVVALGSPFQLQNTVTFGIVSATARHSSDLGLAKNPAEYIQTDAAINVGNSGGPLVNINGEVIGINTMKVDGGSGVSFAIPIDIANQVLQQLMNNRRVVRPYIGIRMANIATGRPNTRVPRRPSRSGDIFAATDGTQVIVVDVDRGSPAQQAGVQGGDIILSVNGKMVKGVRDLLDAIGYEIGRPIELKLLRRGRGEITITVISTVERTN